MPHEIFGDSSIKSMLPAHGREVMPERVLGDSGLIRSADVAVFIGVEFGRVSHITSNHKLDPPALRGGQGNRLSFAPVKYVLARIFTLSGDQYAAQIFHQRHIALRCLRF